MGFTLPIRKQGRKVSYKSKKRRCTTVNSQAKSWKLNIRDTTKTDNFVGNLNLSRINIKIETSLDKIITLNIESDIESSICINYETIEEYSV